MSAYNGWTNYETWCVNLWIDNEESSQSYWSENTRELLSELERDPEITIETLLKDMQGGYDYEQKKEELLENFDPEDYKSYPLTEEEKHLVACDLANRLKDEIEEANPLQDHCSMFSDLLSASLSEVNWYEIAEAMIAGETE